MAKIGVIDVGGGLRGIYAAGVFDWCLENGVKFDYGIGISAGSANLASYLSGQRGRNYLFYEEYSMRRQYMGAGNMLRSGSFLNLQYIYGTLSNAGCENPLDFEKMSANPMEWYMIATDATTGKPKYFTRSDMQQDDYRVLMASCCIPVACKPIVIDGIPYYDGALGDTIPLKKAFADGCDKVVLILTKPEGTVRADSTDRKLARVIRRRYPKAAEQLALRAQHYNEGIALAEQLAAEGKVLIIAPDDTCGVKTLTRDQEALKKLYSKGIRDAQAIEAFIKINEARRFSGIRIKRRALCFSSKITPDSAASS